MSRLLHYGKEYDTVSQEAERLGDRAAQVELDGKDPDAQIDFLTSVFERAVAYHDDESAQKFARLIFWALEDAEFVPILSEEPGSRYLPHGDRVDEAIQRAQRAVAQKAMELWEKTPTHIKEPDRHLSTWRDIPTLPETKKTLLAEVVERWRKTGEETEADQLFNFLVGLRSSFPKERGMFEDVIRKATDQSFPVVRLTRHIIATALRPGPDEETLRILAIARARNGRLESLALEISAVEPLNGCSPAAYALARTLLAQVAELDRAAESLEARLRQEWGSCRPWLPGYSVSGTPKVSYSFHGPIEVCLNIELRHERYRAVPFDENKMHEWFDIAKQSVICWQVKHHFMVDLKIRVCLSGKELCARQQQLAIEATRTTTA